MKKLLIIVFVFCLLLVGCVKKETENTNATWQSEEYDSIEEMNKAIGSNITSSTIADKTNEKFIVIQKEIAQYSFSINNENWYIRASKNVDSDISGLYYDNIQFEKDVEATYYNDEVYVHRFFNNGIQYVIILDVKNKNIARSYFDDVWSDLQTDITGIKSGYETTIFEDGDNVVYRTIMHNTDGTSVTINIIYTYEDDKMVLITNNNIFDNKKVAEEYYNELIEAGHSAEEITLKGNTISSSSTDNVDFYNEMTKAEFIQMMKDSLNQ